MIEEDHEKGLQWLDAQVQKRLDALGVETVAQGLAKLEALETEHELKSTKIL